MIVRFIELDKDYSDVCSWWEQQASFVVPRPMLSTTGFIVEHDSDKLLAGWLYHTNSNVAMFEFLVGNPKFVGKIRSEALTSFFDTLFKYADMQNIKNIISTTSHPKVPAMLERVGFVKVNENVTNFMRSV